MINKPERLSGDVPEMNDLENPHKASFDVSVIAPVYNEERSVATLYALVRQALELESLHWELVLMSLGQSPKMQIIAASVVVDKIVSIIGLLVVGCIGLALSETPLPQSLTWLFVVFGLIAILSLFSLRADWVYSRACRFLARLRVLLPRQERILNGFSGLFKAWHAYSRNLLLLTGNILLAVLYQFVGVLMFYLLARGLQLSIGFVDWSWIVAALTLALFLPLTIGGLGVREGTLIGILGMYGYESEAALALLLMAFSFVIMLAIIGATLSFTIKAPRKAVP